MNGCHTVKHFRLERGARQGDLILANLFILALEILPIFIRYDKNIDGINNFNDEYIYITYADGRHNGLLKNQTSVKNALPGLSPNLDKCEVAGK